jgi:hypothetical protein
MRRLAWLAVLLVLTACATDRALVERTRQRDRDTALLRDARECEEDADDQLRNAGQDDPGIRLLYFRACMGLRGWQVE